MLGFSIVIARRFFVTACLGLVTLAAAEPELALRGRVEPPRRADVALYGAVTPFHRRTFSDNKGRFEFKKVPAGSYTVAVFQPAGSRVFHPRGSREPPSR